MSCFVISEMSGCNSPIVTFREQFVMYFDFSFDEV